MKHRNYLGDIGVVVHSHPFNTSVAMSIVDSAAAFERKCKELRGGEDLFTGLSALGVKDFSTLAFTLGTPQKAPSDQQFDELGTKVFGVATVGQLALLRKLHFEATTLIVASINEQVKSDTADPTSLTKRLPAAEKQSRLESQVKRLAGLKITGELSPSHQLLDLTNAMMESGVITWVAPSKCSKRDDEVQANIKPSPSTLQIEQATLKVAQVPIATSADVGSELKLQWALQRRGIALDQCRLLDWATHEDWAQWLLQSLTRDVPNGFTSVKVDQVIRADKELWTVLAQQSTGSLKPTNDVPALNEPFKKLTSDPRITMFVLPLPSAAAKQVQAPPQPPVKKPDAGTVKPAQGPQQPGKRRKLSRAEKNCPEELKKYKLRLEGKGNICWNFNMASGCSNSTTGTPAKCMRGFHVCANCHKPGHSVATCRSKAS